MPAETHSHRSPLDRDEIARIVCEQLAEILDVDPDVVTLDARLREDLDADDFALHRPRGRGRGRARRAIGRPHDRRRRSRRADDGRRRGRLPRRATRRGAPRDRIASAIMRSRRSRRRPSSKRRSASHFADPSLLLALARAPFVVRRERRSRVERTARVPRRLRARARRDPLRVRALPRTSPKDSSRRCGPAS